jgi:hypothetical protein
VGTRIGACVRAGSDIRRYEPSSTIVILKSVAAA